MSEQSYRLPKICLFATAVKITVVSILTKDKTFYLVYVSLC
jgi:hypothetical protein